MSERCLRFEREGLQWLEIQREREERGREETRGARSVRKRLEAHVAGCEDCRRIWDSHTRLQQHLRALPTRGDVPEDFAERILKNSQRRVARRRWASWAGSVAAVAAALLAVLWIPLDMSPNREVSVALRVVPSEAAPLRGTSARVGDRLHLTAELGPGTHAELRVFRDGENLVLRCPSGPACTQAGSRVAAELRLDAPGRYEAVVMTASQPLPSPPQSLEADAAAVQEAGGEVVLSQPIEVH